MTQDALVVAGKPDFDGRQLDRTLLQLAQEDAGFRSRLRQARAQRPDQLRRDFRRLGRDQQLGVVLVWQLRIDIVVEARKARPDERGVVDYLLLMAQHIFDAPHRGLGRFHLPAFRKPDVDHKLVALGEGEEPLGKAMEHERARRHSEYAECDRDGLPSHGHHNHAVVDRLHDFQRRAALLSRSRFRSDAALA